MTTLEQTLRQYALNPLVKTEIELFEGRKSQTSPRHDPNLPAVIGKLILSDTSLPAAPSCKFCGNTTQFNPTTKFCSYCGKDEYTESGGTPACDPSGACASPALPVARVSQVKLPVAVCASQPNPATVSN